MLNRSYLITSDSSAPARHTYSAMKYVDARYKLARRSEPEYADLSTDRPRDAYSLLSTRVPTAWIKTVCKEQCGKLAKTDPES